MLSTTQSKFIALEKKKEEIKKYFDELKQATEELAAEIGIDGTFQDPEDGTVFKVVKPEGKFIVFDAVSYVRTKREGEARGSLSLIKAREAGYEV